MRERGWRYKKGKDGDLWAGTCALREAGTLETGGGPVHRETPSQVGPRRSCRVLKNKTKQGLGRKQKAALLSLLTFHKLWSQPDGRLREPRMGRHINLDRTHNS